MNEKQLKKLENLLQNWGTLNEGIMELSESELATILALEINSRKRDVVLRRVYSRYNVLRRERELLQLLYKGTLPCGKYIS